MALPTVKAVGRLGITVGDSADPDDEPEITWCDEGEVWLTPTIAIAQYPEGAPVSPTLGNSVTKLAVDTEGYLTYRGLQYVKVFDLTSDLFNPHVGPGKATHQVQFKGVKCDGVEVRFTDGPARLATDTVDEALGAVNIMRQMPVPVAGGVAIVVGPPGPPGDPELTDEVTAMNLATGTATRAALASAAEDLELGGGVSSWNDLTDKPTTFTPATHAHAEYAPVNHTHSGYAATSHTHSEYAPTSHTHAASTLTGTLAIANAPAGSVFYRRESAPGVYAQRGTARTDIMFIWVGTIAATIGGNFALDHDMILLKAS